MCYCFIYPMQHIATKCHRIHRAPLKYLPSLISITSYDFLVVMYLISFVMIILSEPSFRIHMPKTLRRMSWRARRSQKENRKSPKLPRSPKPQKSQKRRVLKGMYKRSPLPLYIYTYVYISVHCYVNISFQREKKEKEPKEPKEPKKRGRKPTVHYDDEGNPVEKDSKPKR